MKPLARWTIGNVTKNGYECLFKSIESFTKLYDVDVLICYNCELSKIENCNFNLFDQNQYANIAKIKPIGVSWKLYPPRIDSFRHEIVIDNDIVFESKVPEIDYFFENDCTLLLEGDSRTYGRFENHVPNGYQINSGIYGMPPNFCLKKYVEFYCNEDWQINAFGQHEGNKTFDEQGLIALSLLDYKKFCIIPAKSITNCEKQLVLSKGMHFISLNRLKHHRPYALYKSLKTKIHL